MVVQGGSDWVSYPHGGHCSKVGIHLSPFSTVVSLGEGKLSLRMVHDHIQVVSGYISTPPEHKGTR
ncbi:hypothetical protein TanjilG_02860 [Lupinus angustifolius]|uniref:Uncharacterized protein n=1 Tax=Lupinus angustifolius TaxID=3871 RepID=A0A4P1RL58_LUPAN|nr:hypothetical protein TanjilG_02860 [Lupinus angustifolius]